jgi:hypothetical protein
MKPCICPRFGFAKPFVEGVSIVLWVVVILIELCLLGGILAIGSILTLALWTLVANLFML